MNEENKNKKGYFVFFGPPNVGKSTMVGYILTQGWTYDKLLKEEQKFKEQFGSKYRQDRYYTYFVDKNKDEYTKQPNQKEGGTSKEVHIHNFDKFVLIDTPGDNRYKKQRYKGLSLANTGIFAIEIKQLLDIQEAALNGKSKESIKNIRDFFSSWYVWQKLHGAANTIILLTKYDLHSGKEDYEDAIDVLSKIIGDDAINAATVIPTSIGLKLEDRKDTNVFTKLEEEWYNGKTLIQAIEEKNSICSSDDRNDLLMFYNRDFGNVKSVGYTIKWKVASGTISTKDKIKIAPVLLKNNYDSVFANIKSMQNESKETIEFGEAGDIISTALSSIVYHKTIIQKKEISICKTAIITNENRKIKSGNKITVSVNIDNCTSREFSIINQIYTDEQIRFLWYGRILYPHVYERDTTQENKIIFILELDESTEIEGRYIALPEDMFPKKTLLQLTKWQNDLGVEVTCNYNCEVTHIE
jgi:translation elongation factor EF-1alpha